MTRLIFSLYSTSACHLCEQAESMLEALFQAPGLLPPLVAGDADGSNPGIAVDIVDISDDDALMARYGVRIPVLAYQDNLRHTHELGWPFQPEQLLYFIRHAVMAHQPPPLA